MRPGTVVADRFEIERRTGAGGMGMVFQAQDRTTGRRVAVKVLHRQGQLEVQRFEREARALAALSHPRIVGYVSHGIDQAGDLYLAMEWIEGEDLESRLERGRLSIDDVRA